MHRPRRGRSGRGRTCWASSDSTLVGPGDLPEVGEQVQPRLEEQGRRGPTRWLVGRRLTIETATWASAAAAARRRRSRPTKAVRSPRSRQATEETPRVVGARSRPRDDPRRGARRGRRRRPRSGSRPGRSARGPARGCAARRPRPPGRSDRPNSIRPTVVPSISTTSGSGPVGRGCDIRRPGRRPAVDDRHARDRNRPAAG